MENHQDVVKRVVDEIVESNREILSQQADPSKFTKLVPQLIKKGLNNLNLSMFNPELKFGILTAMGKEYRKKGNLNDAVKAFVLASNTDMLNDVAEDYERIMQFDNCIEVYKLAN